MFSNNIERFWGEKRCGRSWALVLQYHNEYFVKIHDFEPLFRPPRPPTPPPVLVQPPPPNQDGDLPALSDKGKTQTYADAKILRETYPTASLHMALSTKLKETQKRPLAKAIDTVMKYQVVWAISVMVKFSDSDNYLLINVTDN